MIQITFGEDDFASLKEFRESPLAKAAFQISAGLLTYDFCPRTKRGVVSFSRPRTVVFIHEGIRYSTNIQMITKAIQVLTNLIIPTTKRLENPFESLNTPLPVFTVPINNTAGIKVNNHRDAIELRVALTKMQDDLRNSQ